MQQAIFNSGDEGGTDVVATSLKFIAQNILIVAFGLLPILFIPTTSVTLGAAKTIILIVAVFSALIFFSLSVLRTGSVNMSAPIALWAMWGVAIATLLSAILSGDIRDAIMGNFFEIHTTVFITLLALIATLTGLLLNSKVAIMRLYTLLTISTVVLAVYHLGRIFIGADVLSLGVFSSSVSSPIGGWNDLALFFGFVILIAVVAIEQLPLTKWGQIFVSGVVAVALVMLAIINFYAIWFVLGLAGLVLLVYGLTKDRFQTTQALTNTVNKPTLASIGVSAALFVVSLIFVIGGSFVSSTISSWANISYVEVRPSLTATIDIGRSVYAENAFTGIGANRFADAWRTYKDPAINETIFWNTDFPAGNGYVTTQFVNTGVIGTALWIVFFGALVYAGLTMLFKTAHADRFWYFIGTSAFVAALYLWGMFTLYVPGVTLLALAAVSSGIVFVAYGKLLPGYQKTFTMAMDRRGGFILIGLTMVLIVVATSALYLGGREFYAQYMYGAANQGIQAGQSIDEVEAQVVEAFELSENDVFAGQIATYQLARLNSLLALTEPNEEQQRIFQNAIANGISAAERAVELDPTEPRYHAILGSIYSVLATANIEGARDRAQAAFDTARQYDPRNPEYALLEAQLLSRVGDLEGAREKVAESIRLKRNYTDAFYFLSQLDIAAGDTEAAIEATRATISLEPRNPARQYQLGVLLAATENYSEAIRAFEQAVALDRNYANARYFLALAYVEEGRVDEAIAQLEVVQSLNPENANVSTLISEIRNTGQAQNNLPVVAEPAAFAEPDAAVVSPANIPESDLITPVNVVDQSQRSEAQEAAPDPEPTETVTETVE